MASRLNGRREVLVPRAICPERLLVIRNYCEPAEVPSHIAVVPVDYDPATGLMRLDDLAAKLSTRTAAVYLENPTYLGVIESQAAEIARLARGKGALTIVGVDPISGSPALSVQLTPGGSGQGLEVPRIA